MPNPTTRTECLSPEKNDGKPGQEAAAMRALWPLIVGLIASGLLGWPYGVLVGGAGLTLSVQLFLNWWLNRRLLCLGGDKCAIGIVWSVEPAEGKPFPESFDDDFSINLLLSPAAPGDGPGRFPTQAVLVREQPKIKAAGLTTFGDAVSAVSVRGCMEEDSEQYTILNPGKKGYASVEAKDDPDPVGGGTSSWEQFKPEGSLDTANCSGIWEPQKTDGNLPEGWQKSSLPHTQLLHIEFEGTIISNLQPTLLVVGILGTLGTAGAGIYGGGLLGSVLFPLGLLALLLFAVALLVSAVSHDGTAADAKDDPLSGDPKPVGMEGFGKCEPWDKSFNFVGVVGRWVYDAGHSRGWNELHPVTFIQLLATAESERKRQDIPVSGDDPLKGTLGQTRPETDAATKSFLDFWCREVAAARQPGFKLEQRNALVDLHPAIRGAKVPA